MLFPCESRIFFLTRSVQGSTRVLFAQSMDNVCGLNQTLKYEYVNLVTFRSLSCIVNDSQIIPAYCRNLQMIRPLLTMMS
jgi:hypothetical protein